MDKTKQKLKQARQPDDVSQKEELNAIFLSHILCKGQCLGVECIIGFAQGCCLE